MPWRAADASKYNKAAKSRRDKALWASVANTTRDSCISAGGSPADCDAKAIRAANSALLRRHSEKMTKKAAQIKEVTKRIGGTDYPASAFLVVEDPESPTTWHLPVKTPDGSPDHRLMGAAWAALHGGYRGNKYEGPGKSEAIAKLRRMYDSEGMDVPAESQAEVQEEIVPEYEPEGATLDGESVQAPEPKIAEVGRRLQSKQIASLKAANEAIAALLKWAEYGDSEEDEEDETEPVQAGEGYQSMGAKQGEIIQAFWMQYCEGDPGEMPEFWPIDVLEAHPQLGDSLIAKEHETGLTYAVPYTYEEGSPVVFGMPPWATVVATYAPVGISQPPEPGNEPGAPPGAEGAPAPDEAAPAESAPDSGPQAPEPGPEPEPEPEPEPVLEPTEELAESWVGLAEIESLEEASGGNSPLAMDVILIQPGWGNTRDNHYYPAEMLRRDAKVFEGAKMYETDHIQAEKSTRTWVSTVESIKGFTDGGAPIARVVVHDSSFAERVKALNEAGLLSKMECSILATGKAVRGKAPDGKDGKIVEQIVSALAVDWVTRAGAGGQAVALTEAIPEPDSVSVTEIVEVPPIPESAPEPPPAPEPISLGEVTDIVSSRPGLPMAVKERLVSGLYYSPEAVKEAIEKEIAYIKAVTGSGSPFEHVEATGSRGKPKGMTQEEYDARMAKIIEKYS